MRKTTKKSKKVEEMLCTTFRGNQATRYGQITEGHTRQEYEEYQRKNGHPSLATQPTEIVNSVDNPWLAANLVEHSSEQEASGLAKYKPLFCLGPDYSRGTQQVQLLLEKD